MHSSHDQFMRAIRREIEKNRKVRELCVQLLLAFLRFLFAVRLGALLSDLNDPRAQQRAANDRQISK